MASGRVPMELWQQHGQGAASGRVPIRQRMVFSVAIAVALAGDCMEASVF